MQDAYMDVGSTIPRKESVESSQEQRPRVTQDAYMDVSGRTTQETKSSSYRGAIVEVGLLSPHLI